MGIMNLFATLSALAALSVIGCEWVSKFTKAKGTMAQIQSWAVSVTIGIFCSWLEFGIFNDVSTKGGILYGILIGLISNGIFDISLVKRVLEMVRLRESKPSEDKNQLIKS